MLYLLVLFVALSKFSAWFSVMGGQWFERVSGLVGFYVSPGLLGGEYIAFVILFANLAREAVMNLEFGALQEGLSSQERTAFETGIRTRHKNVWIAYVLLLAFGFVGAHKFYLGQKGMGFLYAFTFGLLFIGVLVDASRLENKVRAYNERIEHDTLQGILAQRARGTQPA